MDHLFTLLKHNLFKLLKIQLLIWQYYQEREVQFYHILDNETTELK